MYFFFILYQLLKSQGINNAGGTTYKTNRHPNGIMTKIQQMYRHIKTKTKTDNLQT